MQNTNKRSRNVWTCRNDIWKQIWDTKCCNVVQIVGVVFEHYYHFKRNGLVICFHFMQHCVYLFVCVCVGVCLQNRSLLYYFWSISQQESSLPWPDIYYTLKCTYMHMQTHKISPSCMCVSLAEVWRCLAVRRLEGRRWWSVTQQGNMMNESR